MSSGIVFAGCVANAGWIHDCHARRFIHDLGFVDDVFFGRNKTSEGALSGMIDL
jgi:hypothetical protein